MGRRKLGQPRVHRIVIMDQYANEIESHELDEFGRLKEKITNTKKTRTVNLLPNNNNVQGNPNQMMPRQDHPRLQQPFLNLPSVGIQKISPAEYSTHLKNNTKINPLQNLNEQKLKNDNFNIPPVVLLPNSSLNTNNEISDKLPQQNHNSFEPMNPQIANSFINIPQPQISPKVSDNMAPNFSQNVNHIIKQEENATQVFENANNQPIFNSIPIPIVKPSNPIAPSFLVDKKMLIAPNNTILNDNGFGFRSFTFTNSFFNHMEYQKIFELPEEPSVPLFIIEKP